MRTSKLFFLILIICASLSFGDANAFLFWNQACHFFGTSTGYVAVPNSGSLNINGSFTLEAWVLPNNSASPSIQMLMEKRAGLAPNGITLFLNNGRISIATNGVTRLIGNVILQNNVWTHIAVTFNSSNSLFTIYENGIPDISASAPNSIPIPNNDSLTVGKGNIGVSRFAGNLDEVRIWRRNLSGAEVFTYRRTSLGSSTGIYNSLVLSLTFQDKESSGPDFSLLDWSGNNNDGVNKGVSAFDLSNRPSVTIAPNDCIELNGVSDYVTGSDNGAVSPVPAITLEAWIFPRSVSGSRIIIHKGTATGSGVNYLLRLNGNMLNAVINGNSAFNSTGVINANQWSHVAFTYEGSGGKYSFYVNGRRSNQGNNPQGNIMNGSENLNIGSNGSTGNYFNGFIDEVRISNYVKSPKEISRFLYRSIDRANEPNPLLSNVVYNLDGYAYDNCSNGPVLNFMSGSRFAHAAAVDNQPVSPVNRADDLNFANGFYMRSSGKRIPMTGTAGVVIDSLEIGFDTLLTDVNVFVALNHSAEEEIEMYLSGPQGETVMLYDRQSLVSNSDNVITIFDEQADSSVANNMRYVSYAPSIKPKNLLSPVFSGKRTAGILKLIINDVGGGGTGNVNAWGLQFNNMTGVIPGLALRVFMQGFYREIDSCITDTLNVHLRGSAPPYPDVGIMGETPDDHFVGFYNFNSADVGVGYYLQVLHRNSIEIWSAHPVIFDLQTGSLSYDFTVSADSAYGSNQVQVEDVPLRFAMYSGDVNQDGNIDAPDLSDIDDDVYMFAVGYLNTDVTGDDIVDASDLTIADNNAFNFISKIVPP